MYKVISKIVVPATIVGSSLGLVASVAAIPAGASTTTTTAAKSHAAATLSGGVVKAEAAKHTFWLRVGAKTYRVKYSATTKFTKGSAASLLKGAAVAVTGTHVGKSDVVISASSISA